MARIRTIKPDFWTDEKMVECSFEARLFFIGLWNFADDFGNLRNSPKKLKMQIFPSDAIDGEKVISELIKNGLLILYDNNGEKFLHIKGFDKHQKVDKKANSSIPKPTIMKSSEEIPNLSDSSEKNPLEGEWKGNGMEERDANASLVSEAVQLWNDTAVKINLSKVQTITKSRKSSLLARLRSCGGLDGWRHALEKIQKIPWMYDGSAKGGWQVNFDFLLQEKSFTKLMEGSYDAKFGTNTNQLTDLERTLLAAF